MFLRSLLTGVWGTTLRTRKFLPLQTNICRSCQKIINRRAFSSTSRTFGVFEPDDLKTGPDIPEYDLLNVSLRGYDYVILESYAKYVHNQALSLGLAADAWPVPPKVLHIETFKTNSTVPLHNYDLKMYERIVQLQDLPSTLLSLFVSIIRCHMPQGITVTLKEHDELEDENRYIPDKQILDLQAEMEALSQTRKKKK